MIPPTNWVYYGSAVMENRYQAEHEFIDAMLELNRPVRGEVIESRRRLPFSGGMDPTIGRSGGLLLMAILERFADNERPELPYWQSECLLDLARSIIRDTPLISVDDLVLLTKSPIYSRIGRYAKYVHALFAPKIAEFGLSPELAAALDVAIVSLELSKDDPAARWHALELHKLRYGAETALPPFLQWWQIPFRHACYDKLNEHANTFRSPRPSERWKAKARRILVGIPTDDLLNDFKSSVDSIKASYPGLDPLVAEYMRGLCWIISLVEHERTTRLVGEMMRKCGMLAHGGPNCFNAGMFALIDLNTMGALAELKRAQQQFRVGVVASFLNKTLEYEIKRRDIDHFDLEEMVFPTFELDDCGSRCFEVGDSSARVTLNGKHVSINWFQGERPLKSRPNHVSHFEFAALDAATTKKEIEAVITALSNRLERVWLEERAWSLSQFQQWYLSHPVACQIARGLIWIVQTDNGKTLVLPSADGVYGLDGKFVSISEEAKIRLWHPITSDLETVSAWRERLVRLKITQPFKQAHKVIYTCGTSEESPFRSSRFSGHILRLKKCGDILSRRGWAFKPSLRSVQASVATLRIPRLKWTANIELSSESLAGEFDIEEGVRYVEVKTVYLTDELGNMLNLRTIPPVIFSEIMSEVDTLVNESSLATLTFLSDSLGQKLRLYWTDSRTEDLSPLAMLHCSVLNQILPLLAPHAEVDGRTLKVKGKLGEYRIDIPTGTASTCSGDQTLDFPGRKPKKLEPPFYRPFDGDPKLDALLEKASALANDSKIRDAFLRARIRAAD